MKEVCLSRWTLCLRDKLAFEKACQLAGLSCLCKPAACVPSELERKLAVSYSGSLHSKLKYGDRIMCGICGPTVINGLIIFISCDSSTLFPWIHGGSELVLQL